MSGPDRHKFSPVDIVVVLVIMALFGWFVMSQTMPSKVESETRALLHPSPNQRPRPADTITDPVIRAQYRTGAVTNNLRQISSVAAQFMLDNGVTVATYNNLVGTNTDNYIRNVAPVAGEDYSRLIIRQTATQLSISAASFGTVTFNM